MGQVFNPERNKDIPSKSSLDQKMSDVVGEINYNFSKIGNIDYKFSLDHNFNTLNYNEVSTNLNFGKVAFNLDYLEERNHVGSENYVNYGVSLNFNDNNKLSFTTKKNFKTNSTELYNISYQYAIDCLTAGLTFRREFYEDSDTDVKTRDSLMFMITFVPFGGVKTPNVSQ
jgi:LPS-assembly protein